MLHPLYLLLVPGLTLVLGCASSAASSTPGPATPGQAPLTIRDHVGWPYDLRAIRVTIDGAPVYEGDGDGAVAALPPGGHTLSIAAEYSYASAGKDCNLEVRASSALTADAAANGVTIHLYRRSLTADFERGVQIALMAGAHPARVSTEHAARGDACSGRGPLVHDEDWTEPSRDAERRRVDRERVTILP